MSLATIEDAITWARDRWHNQRMAPAKLHKWETEGVGVFFSPPFGFLLDAPIHAHASVTGTETCYHPQLRIGVSLRDCPDCGGYGVKQHTSERYHWPMSVALHKLQKSLGPARQPHPYALVLSLAENGWNWHATAIAFDRSDETAEALILMALRRLHGFYAEGPVNTRVSWVDKSESQRAAETAA